jgi:hypothetical protein
MGLDLLWMSRGGWSVAAKPGEPVWQDLVGHDLSASPRRNLERRVLVKLARRRALDVGQRTHGTVVPPPGFMFVL